MKHLQKFNELVEYKEGDILDPTMDVEEFKKRFEKRLRKNDVVRLDVILSRFPTQTDEWQIYDISLITDDHWAKGAGCRTKNICYVKGVTPYHARVRASLITNNIEIFTDDMFTGFYKTEVISDGERNKRISLEVEKVEKINNTINNLKNPL